MSPDGGKKNLQFLHTGMSKMAGHRLREYRACGQFDQRNLFDNTVLYRAFQQNPFLAVKLPSIGLFSRMLNSRTAFAVIVGKLIVWNGQKALYAKRGGKKRSRKFDGRRDMRS